MKLFVSILSILIASWDASEGAAHYTLYELTTPRKMIAQTTQTQVTFNALKGTRVYAVSASNQGGESALSNSVKVRVKPK